MPRFTPEDLRKLNILRRDKPPKPIRYPGMLPQERIPTLYKPPTTGEEYLRALGAGLGWQLDKARAEYERIPEPLKEYVVDPFVDINKDALAMAGDVERAYRLLSLPIGMGVSAAPLLTDPVGSFAGDSRDPQTGETLLWDLEKTPEAFEAFRRELQGGDSPESLRERIDRAIPAATDEFGGTLPVAGFSELLSYFLGPGGLKLAGQAMREGAPRFAGFAARPLPARVRPQVETGMSRTGEGAGRILETPWEAEEALGKGVVGALKWAGRPVVGGASGVLGAIGARIPATKSFSEEIADSVRGIEADLGTNLPKEAHDLSRVGALLDYVDPTAPVYTGPPPGLHNLSRLDQQRYKIESLRDRGLSPEQWQDQILADALDARRAGQPKAEMDFLDLAAREARIMKPVATGKKALLSRLKFEVRKTRLNEATARVAERWLNMLPDRYLDDLGSSYVSRIRGGALPGMEVGGRYTPGGTVPDQNFPWGRVKDINQVRVPSVINISLKMVNNAGIADRIIVHEVAHHLEDFVPQREVDKLIRQWERDLRDRGNSLIAEVNKINAKAAKGDRLTYAEEDKIDSAYRFTNFKEWFAEVLTDKALRDIYREIPGYRNVIDRALASIREMAEATRRFIADVLGRGDEAERIYKNLLEGNYTARERRSTFRASETRDIDRFYVAAGDPIMGSPGGKPPVGKRPGGKPPRYGDTWRPFDIHDRRFQMPKPDIGKGYWGLMDMDQAIGIETTEDFGRKFANIWGIKKIMQWFNPSAVANSVEARGAVGFSNLTVDAEQKAGVLMTRLWRIGSQRHVFGRVDDRGLLTKGPLKGYSLNDVRSRRKYFDKKLTSKQREWIEVAHELEEEKLEFLKRNGIDIKTLEFEDGGEYAGRRVMGKRGTDPETNQPTMTYRFVGTGRKGAKLPSEYQREYETARQAIEDGFVYLPEDEALYQNILSAYHRVAEKDFADWIIKNHPSVRLKAGRKDVPSYTERSGAGGEFGRYFQDVIFTDPKVADFIAAQVNQKVNKALSEGAKVSAAGRIMMLGGDASHFLIQLLYLPGAKGGLKAYGWGIQAYVRTLFDPRYGSGLIDNHKALLAKYHKVIMSNMGNEYTEAMERGGLLGPDASKLNPFRSARFKKMMPNLAPKLGGLPLNPFWYAGKALKPFARALNTSMDEAAVRILLTLDEALKPKTFEEISQISDYVNMVRGLSSSQRIGVSPNMRAVESNALLASRYTRSIVAVLWSSIADGGIRGEQTRLTFSRALAAYVSIASALSIAEYHRNTDEKDQTREGYEQAILDHILPTRSKFMTWELYGVNIGPGTKFRSLLKLWGSIQNAPDSLMDEADKNPILRFGRGNLAPTLSAAWDLFSGRNYMGDPTGTKDGFDLGKILGNVIAPRIMPIWVHAALLEGGTLEQRGAIGFAEFAGARAYAETRMDMKEELSREMHGKSYHDLNALPQIIIDAEIDKREGKEFKGKYGPIRKQIDTANTVFYEGLQEIADEWLTAPQGGPNFSPIIARKGLPGKLAGLRELQNDRMLKLFGPWIPDKGRRANGYYEKLYDMDKAREEPERGTNEHALWRYYKVYEDSRYPESGKMNWDMVTVGLAEFWAGLRDEEQATYMFENIHTLEGLYPPEMATLVDAGRYAGSLKIPIGPKGVETTFYGIVNHPHVVSTIMSKSGFPEHKVREYLRLHPLEQDLEVSGAGEFEDLKPIVDEEFRRYGVIGQMRSEFANAAGGPWVWAMFDSGYKWGSLGEDSAAEIKKKMREGTLRNPGENYKDLYRENLVPNIGRIAS